MNTLLKCGADDAQMDVAHRYLEPLAVDTRCNRSEQGTLNQMKRELEHHFRQWATQVLKDHLVQGYARHR